MQDEEFTSLFKLAGGLLPFDSNWEFRREKLNFIGLLGSGAFGQVWLAEAEGLFDKDALKKEGEASKRRRAAKRNLDKKNFVRGQQAIQSHKTDLISTEKPLVAVKILKGKL